MKGFGGLGRLESLGGTSSGSSPLLIVCIVIALAICIVLIYILFLRKYLGRTISCHKELKKGVNCIMELSGRMRIVIVMSVLWILVFFAIAVEEHEMLIFLTFGIIPIITGWGIAWILRGFKEKEITSDMDMFNLGSLYYFGTGGIPKDYKKAAKYFAKSAEQGNFFGQEHLGVAYSKGEGVPQNYQEAAKWFRKAAKQGHPVGQYYLGIAYSKGEGVPRDYIKAYAWLNLASQGMSGNTAQLLDDLANQYMTPQQITDAERLTTKLQSEIKNKSKPQHPTQKKNNDVTLY